MERFKTVGHWSKQLQSKLTFSKRRRDINTVTMILAVLSWLLPGEPQITEAETYPRVTTTSQNLQDYPTTQKITEEMRRANILSQIVYK